MSIFRISRPDDDQVVDLDSLDEVEMKNNCLKLYDRFGLVLRIETVHQQSQKVSRPVLVELREAL